MADDTEVAARAVPVATPRHGLGRRLLLVLLIAAAAVLAEVAITFRFAAPPSTYRGPGVDRPAAAFDLVTLDGRRVALADYLGRPLVVNFWASWCPPCREEAPLLAQLARQAPGDAAVIGILYQDTPEEAAKFVEEFGVPYPTLLDPQGTTAIDYGLTGIPETFFIDRDGVIRALQIGALTPGDLQAKIQSITGP